MEDLKKFLTERVLFAETDALPPETEKVLQRIRREKNEKPVIYVSSGTSSIIAGSEKTTAAVITYIEENQPDASLVRVGCTGPANFEPLVCLQLPGKNKLYFRNITEERLNRSLTVSFITISAKTILSDRTGPGVLKCGRVSSSLKICLFLHYRGGLFSTTVVAMILKALRNTLPAVDSGLTRKQSGTIPLRKFAASSSKAD